MDFTNLDFLYRNSPEAYKDLLLFMLSEFEVAEEKFRNYAREQNIDAFSQLRHKLFSTLTTLGCSELRTLLDQIHESLVKEETEEVENSLPLLSAYFEVLRSNFLQKLQPMTEEQLM